MGARAPIACRPKAPQSPAQSKLPYFDPREFHFRPEEHAYLSGALGAANAAFPIPRDESALGATREARDDAWSDILMSRGITVFVASSPWRRELVRQLGGDPGMAGTVAERLRSAFLLSELAGGDAESLAATLHEWTSSRNLCLEIDPGVLAPSPFQVDGFYAVPTNMTTVPRGGMWRDEVPPWREYGTLVDFARSARSPFGGPEGSAASQAQLAIAGAAELVAYVSELPVFPADEADRFILERVMELFNCWFPGLPFSALGDLRAILDEARAVLLRIPLREFDAMPAGDPDRATGQVYCEMFDAPTWAGRYRWDGSRFVPIPEADWYVGICPRWYYGTEFQQTRLIHEAFHLLARELGHSDTEGVLSNTFRLQGFVSDLMGLPFDRAVVSVMAPNDCTG